MRAPETQLHASAPDPSGVGPAAAHRALAGFTAGLRNEAEALETPDTEELLRAVDGELDPAERLLWSERLAIDPLLARRAADLAGFRAELDGQDSSAGDRNVGSQSNLLTFRRSPARVSLVGWLAAAAVLLLAVAFHHAPRLANDGGSASAAASRHLEWSGEELFADGFEAGDASGWSSASPSG